MTSYPDSHLYGAPRPKRNPISALSTSTSSTFAASLSSLLASNNASKSSTTARARASKTRKDDIFSTHNKGAKKRAAADIATDRNNPSTEQKHNVDIGSLDHETLHRSKRKMEEKARLYAAMKRGDYVQQPRRHVNDEETGPLVDFDRKWAEDEAAGRETNPETSSDEQEDSEEEEMVEYEDEFGRTRRGTRVEVARATRQQRMAAHAEKELEELSARPAMPKGVMIGDTVQSGAFNPDERAAEAMASLAARRDRSVTPPEEVHYDASKEVRSKGVGFYQFSRDKEGREREMKALEKEREETVRREKEREERKGKKAREMEERKRKIREMKEGREINQFFKKLEGEMDGGQ